MRKIAMITTALVGLAFANPSFGQGSQSAPVTGLPPGASVGAPNAQPPAATGDLSNTRVGPATVRPRATRTRSARARRRLLRRRAAAAAPATPAPAPAAK
jgi:hypothetical protein